MRTAFILAAVCACALAQGLGGGRPKSCSNAGGVRPQKEALTDAKKEEAKQCMLDFAEKNGVDVDAAKACLKDCPKPERGSRTNGGAKGGASKGGAKGGAKGGNNLKELATKYGVTAEMGKCFKAAAKPIMQSCVANSGVELEVKADRTNRREQNAGDRTERQGQREERQGDRQGTESGSAKGSGKGSGKGNGGKGKGKGGNGNINLEQFVARAQTCGAPAQQCVQSALGPLAADPAKAKVALKAAKEQCFGERPARPEPSAACKADLASIKSAIENCDLETKLTVEARTCNIPEEAITAMKALRAQQQATRGQRLGGGRNKRSIVFVEEFGL